MTLDWDYTSLARAYLKRPAYAGGAIERCLNGAGMVPGMTACDIGAGTGNLTQPLLAAGLKVVAVEPNAAMRRLGEDRTPRQPNLCWIAARAEQTALRSQSFDLVTFGSSFNVVDRGEALSESARILKPGRWLVCLWNHRNLDDPLQSRIEQLIRSRLRNYEYGTRREDQVAAIEQSGLFGGTRRIEAAVVHRVSIADCLEAWRSHATLRRQAGEQLAEILAGIRSLLEGCGTRSIEVPYTTRAWLAQKR